MAALGIHGQVSGWSSPVQVVEMSYRMFSARCDISTPFSLHVTAAQFFGVRTTTQ